MTTQEEIAALVKALDNYDNGTVLSDESLYQIAEAARAHLEQLRRSPTVSVLEVSCCSECGTIHMSNKTKGATNE